MSISLREAWATAEFAPGPATTDVHHPHIEDVGSGPDHTIVVKDEVEHRPVLRLRPLKDGLRASSRARATRPDTSPPFVMGLRALVGSLHYPSAYLYENEWPSEEEVPYMFNTEAQGIVPDGTTWILVTDDALWYYPVDPHGMGTRRLTTERMAETVWPLGVGMRGRRQHHYDTDEETVHPRHLGAPTYAGGLLLIPAEGVPQAADRDADGTDCLWIWVIDPETFGYRGRIKVPKPNGSFPWCAASPDGQFLYTSRFGSDNKDSGDYPPISAIQIHKLPDLSKFWAGESAAEMTADVVERYPEDFFSLEAPLVGELPLTEVTELPAKFMHLQGGSVSPNWHLYLSIEYVDKGGGTERARGVVVIDLLLGKVARWIASDRGDEIEGVWARYGEVDVLHCNNPIVQPAASYVGLGSVLGNDHRQFTVTHFGVAASEKDLV